jgi:drug/metabolite transporter (DMT)-like permease
VSRRGWLLFAAMGVIWGIPYLLIKVADGGVSVPVLVCTRVALGSLLLLPAAVRGGHLAALKGHVRWLAAFTLLEIVGPFALLSNA